MPTSNREWNQSQLAAGGMMVVSFPRVYASGFSGFYLALMIVLWLLILRGVSIEFRSQLDNPLWRALWDTGFWLGSLLLALLLGVALGNVLRGLPIGADGYFQGTFALLLNPYSLLTGILSVVVLAWHGSNYLRIKTEHDLLRTARQWSQRLFWAAVALIVVTTGATFIARPSAGTNFRSHPVALALLLLSLAGLAGGFLSRIGERDQGAFRSSTLTIIGLLGTAAFTVYPNLLTSTLDLSYSLTVFNAASSPLALRASFIANIVGMVGVIVYSTYVHRTFSGKVRLGDHGY